MADDTVGRRTRDRSYVPTVVVGLAGAGLAAVAGAREWATAQGDSGGIEVTASVTGSESQPLVVALALVSLAAWGVVLVLRGRLRRPVAGAGLLAAAAAAVTVGLGLSQAQSDALDAAIARGATGDTFVTGLTAWYYLAGVGAAVAAVAFAVAVIRSPGWPGMGTKYDAPAARTTQDSDEDMWRALDEGRDPTS